MWSQLQRRYNQPRKIVQTHLRALFELPELTLESLSLLRSMSEKAEMHVKALKSLNEPTEHWNAILVYIITMKLDKTTRRSWERSLDNESRPNFDELLSFLHKYSRDDEVSSVSASNKEPTNKGRNRHGGHFNSHMPRNAYTYLNTNSKGIICPVCENDHYIQACPIFLQLEPQDRVNAVKRARLCLNCLRSGHLIKQCTRSTCRKCQGKHNTLLHFSKQSTDSPQDSNAQPPTVEGPLTTLTSSLSSEVLLATARVKILDKHNNEHDCRILLDAGSQSNFITEQLANRLKLNKEIIDIPVSGLGKQLNHIEHSVTTTIRSRCSSFTAQLPFLVLSIISDILPTKLIQHNNLNIPRNLQLADPEFYKPNIDALLGATLFYQLLSVGQVKLNNQGAIMQKTTLGWIISGKVNNSKALNQTVKCHLATTGLELQLRKFWEIEEISDSIHLTDEERRYELHFQSNTQREPSGRYIVQLPFNDKINELGDSYTIALKHFRSLERSLENNDCMRQQYIEFLRQYEALGHMTDVTNSESNHRGCYLPHHAVIKETSVTTKVRVVFDGSAKTNSGMSLNDSLMVGPTIQEDIFSLVSRFRTHAYVLIADIEKMFRQIRVNPNDTVYQRILWRENRLEPIKSYQLNTVTYGTASAPFFAVRSLFQLAEDEGNAFPVAAAAIKQDFYMNDLLTGATTFEGAVQLRDQLIQLTRLGGFNLRQWASNETALIDNLREISSEEHLCLDSNSLSLYQEDLRNLLEPFK